MNVFIQPVTTSYDLTDATWEIIIMLFISFILGWMFNYFWNYISDNTDAKIDTSIPEKYRGIPQTDLKLIEGIGPKIEDLLKTSGILNWGDLASSDMAILKRILESGGERFQMHDPTSWPDQAALAQEGKWDELQEYQELLIGGRA